VNLGEEISLSGGGAGCAASRTAQHIGEGHGDGRANERSYDVDPVTGEVAARPGRGRRCVRVHECARDGPSQKAGQDDVAADSEGAEHAEVRAPDAVPRIKLTRPSVSTDRSGRLYLRDRARFA
jgi:hypothetical protein